MNQFAAANPVQTLVNAGGTQPEGTARHLTLFDKLSLWASWAVAAGIFMTLGWIAMAPDDPYGAVSLLMRGRAAGMWLQAAGLALVTSVIATVLVGRILPFAGPFAAAFGLAVVSLRGGTSESLLLAARTTAGGTKSMAVQMALEGLAWMAVLALSVIVGEATAKWCLPRIGPQQNSLVPGRPKPAYVFPLAAVAIAMLTFNILGAGMQSREIRHTQVCFVVGASVWIGCYVAFRFVPTLTILWYFATAALLTLVGYSWAALQTDSPNLPLSVPPSIFLRVLPIQFAAVGTAGSIAAYWSNLHHQGSYSADDAELEPEGAA